MKSRENVVVLDFLALDFDFTRKNVKNIWVKTRENVFCQNRFFGQKFDFENSVIERYFVNVKESRV